MKYNNKKLPSIYTEIDIQNNSFSSFWLSTAQEKEKKKRKKKGLEKREREKKGYFFLFFHLQNIQRHPAKTFFYIMKVLNGGLWKTGQFKDSSSCKAFLTNPQAHPLSQECS